MTTIKEFAEQRGIKPGKLVDEFRKKYPGQGWTVHSELPSEFVQTAQNFEEQVTNQSQQTQSAPAAGMGEGQITKADEALEQASYKLSQADQATLAEAAETQMLQSDVLGTAYGVQAGLKFTSSFVKGRASVLEVITEENLNHTEECLSSVDDSMLELANQSTEILGNSIRLREKTKAKRQQLLERVNRLTSRIKSS
ncbi:hypothetical protein [Anabaena azotica]|uniref:Uncharacterized protein n=1 Tax=Anabaena azotica FACHB-119 TaxID=947527 RepID=A0ABR8DGK7_9NOST|nr:hypothetical protein [Anabaena azotica]MBD2505327.1 hypothetical protein [Anabaena azotica FACHB-119]